MDITLAYDQYLAVHRYKYLALYHALRAAILEGTLPGGTRLPSTRRLAVLYDLSRGSASQVYDMLLADGYIKAKIGQGTYVSDDSFAASGGNGERSLAMRQIDGGRANTTVNESAGEARSRSTVKDTASLDEAGLNTGGANGAVVNSAVEVSRMDSQYAAIPLSAWGERLMKRQVSLYANTPEDFVSFRSSGVLMEHFPYAEWRSALSYAGGKGGGRLENVCPPQGDEGLRRAIAAHLRITRGIHAEAVHIVLFSGSMQGIVILTQLLLEVGSPAVVEDPGFHGIRRAIEATGGRVLTGKLDSSGLQPENWEARLLFVTPSRQFPTGAVLPLERRRTLLEWAQRHDAVIVEDDYDSEFRWAGRPIEPLKALDRGERVVYVGSFSNSMFRGLRIGFAVLPTSLVPPAIAAKALYEPLPAGLLEQRALARFMNTGGYSRHLRRMTRLYGERSRSFRTLLAERLGGLFAPLPGDAGLHIYARWLRSSEEFAAFQAAARRRGTDFRDAALYRIMPGEPAACFSFSHLNENAQKEGITRLLLAWKDVQNAT